MTSLFPHPPYAEDQPSSHLILYLHVIRASAMSFTFLSLPISLISSRLRKQPLLPTVLLNSGRGLILGTLAGAAMTWGRMRGRSEIEWQDRSWRLLENKGEVDTDWETFGATGVGALAGVVAAKRGVARMGVAPISVGRTALGGAGLGLASGVVFMVGTYATGRKAA